MYPPEMPLPVPVDHPQSLFSDPAVKRPKLKKQGIHHDPMECPMFFAWITAD